MKYLVASINPYLDSKISKRFGHSEHFLIVDSENFEFEVISGVGHDEPSHGIARFLGRDVEAVIVVNIGPGAFNDVRNAGWSVYSCPGLTVKEAVEKVRLGSVPALTAPTMKHSVHSGQKCASHGGKAGS